MVTTVGAGGPKNRLALPNNDKNISLKVSDRLWGPPILLCNGHLGNLRLWLSGRGMKLSSWGQKWVVLYFHFPIRLYGVIRDTITLPNLRNFLYETIVTLYDIYIYIYIYICVCVCVCVCVFVIYLFPLCSKKNWQLLLLTLRRLMSYIYGAPIFDVSRSHTTTHHSR